VSDEFLVTCPFCGEQFEIYVEPDVNGSFVRTAKSAVILGASTYLVETTIGPYM
jgi:hypothetical protein